MTEEHLNQAELTDRCWAVLAATAENRCDDVEELLVTLPWPDLVTVVCGIGSLAIGSLVAHAGLDEETARIRLAQVVRQELLERLASRDGPADAD